uniref:Uncharacterized protein n=1 Tax=Rhizophora mucronata TaxID=61149 RepID=A0A2P2PF80_RHIMU
MILEIVGFPELLHKAEK